MTNSGERVEQRKQKRFRVREGAFVILRPADIGVAQLVDISMDGLTLNYVTSGEPSIQPTQLEIFVTDDPFRLFQVPCKTISDFVTYETYNKSISKRRRGIQFGKLAESQIAQLEYFIQNHTTGEVD